MQTHTHSHKQSLPSLQAQPVKLKNVPSSQTTKASIAVLSEKTRIRNYISLYSSPTSNPFTKPADRSGIEEDQPSSSKSVLKINSALKILSETSTKVVKITENLQSLQRKCADLLYDIQKAMSDKLELIRDVATYEYEFGKSLHVTVALAEISELLKSIPETELQSSGMEESVMDGLDEFLKISENRESHFVENEVFELKRPAYSKVKMTLLNCSFLISDIPCVVNVHGTKWLEELEITINTLSGQTFKKSLKHTILSLYSSKKELGLIIASEILSKFYFLYYYSRDTLTLMHNPVHNETFKVIFYFIRGYGKCSLSLSVVRNLLSIQVVEQKEVLEVPETVLTVKKLQDLNIKTVKKIVQDFIYYDKYTKGFYWQDGKEAENVFITKEVDSNLLKDEYLKDLLSMKSFKVIYSLNVEITEMLFVVELHTYKQHIKLIIFYDRETVEIPQDSRHFKSLLDLQCIEIAVSPVTLQNSLEIRTLIKKHFPKLFNTKPK